MREIYNGTDLFERIMGCESRLKNEVQSLPTFGQNLEILQFALHTPRWGSGEEKAPAEGQCGR
ncbi:MAG: hypothetical protein OHK0041_16220 [Anaerolineales bacterium]